MSCTYEEQKSSYQRNYLSKTAACRAGREEEIRTSPLFSLAVKSVVDSSQGAICESGGGGGSSGPICEGSNKAFPSKSATIVESREPPSTELEPSSSEASTTDSPSDRTPNATPVLPQYGLLGFHIGDPDIAVRGEPIMLNVNAPNSVFICGSQGSGKSYTLSAMLENCLLSDSTIGTISQPVAGVVFHYDVDASASIAEVAHLCSRGIPVDVLVSQSNERALREAYERVGTTSNKPRVRPLLLRSSDLSIDRMNKLMALAEKEGPPPLYMEIVQRILRQMAMQGTTAFDYKHFRRLLDVEKLSKDQMGPMSLRFSLLESFMHADDLPQQQPRAWKPPVRADQTTSKLFNLTPGTLTIIDLSDAFVDASTACILFDICLSLIKAQRPPSGLALALDEAHKFMNTSSAATHFTERLLTTIREQRHNATRVIVATQEPTINPRLLDLCSISIVHRFTSPAWFAAIKQHLGGASAMLASQREQEAMFKQVVELDVGESLVFSPTSFVCLVNAEPGKLGSGRLKMKTRLRVGADGGTSVLASG